jgi:tight adherence protein B
MRNGARLAAGCALALLCLTSVPSVWAADGQIDQIEAEGAEVQVLFSLRDLGVGARTDLSSVTASINGSEVPAKAELASNASDVERVTALTIDVSESMAGERFRQAQSAALAFVDQAPDNVQIALVTFADDAQVVVQPTLDRDAVRSAIDDLSLTRNTALYAGVRTALQTLPAEAQGSLLVLSDGRDTSDEPVQTTLDELSAAKVRVDVVALEQRGESLEILRAIAKAGSGEVIAANDARALTAVFEEQAQVLASQVLVAVATPDGWQGGGATLEVSLSADGDRLVDDAFVSIPAMNAPADDTSATAPAPAGESVLGVSRTVMLVGLGGVALSVLLLALVFSGALDVRKRESLANRIAPYSGSGTHAVARSTAPNAPQVGAVQQAVDATQRLLQARGFDARLANKLDTAGLKLNASEWVLVHASIPFAGALLGYALTRSLFIAALLIVAGAVLPHLYLKRKASKRIGRFNAQLGDTLQLIAGSLSAGLSLAQSIDTVVREGTEPMSGEFRRVLVEQRLGVSIEEAMDGVGKRMHSDDFGWIVMAIRIQRDVGGNLAELLVTVAATLREREYLRRQVRTLTGEGRASAWVLGLLPVVFLGFLMLTNPAYLQPMFTSPLGLLLLVVAVVMMAIGVFWLSKLVKVKV